jgi:DNA-binding LacI/PurR family transcriptional regulator
VPEPEPTLLYEKLKSSIKSDIAARKVTPGDRIPAERLLAETHGVSRITVKKALTDLVAEGFLEHLPNRRGTFVRDRQGPSSSPRFIAVAIDDVRNSFGAQILRGIEDFLWDRRIHTLICNADRDFGKVEEYFQSLRSHDIAGVIFAPVIDAGYREGNSKLVAILGKAQIPFTLVDRYIPRLLANYVGANHEESSRTLTRYLIDHGHRRILLARGLECTSMDEREQGYRNACEEAGIPVDERLVVSLNDNLVDPEPSEEVVKRLKGLIHRAGTFSCFYALNDGLLRAGVAALRALDIDVEKTIQLASHNEIDHPPIPMAKTMPHCIEPTYEMGWEAARVLVEHINDPSRAIVQKILKSRFVPMESEKLP